MVALFFQPRLMLCIRRAHANILYFEPRTPHAGSTIILRKRNAAAPNPCSVTAVNDDRATREKTPLFSLACIQFRGNQAFYINLQQLFPSNVRWISDGIGLTLQTAAALTFRWVQKLGERERSRP